MCRLYVEVVTNKKVKLGCRFHRSDKVCWVWEGFQVSCQSDFASSSQNIFFFNRKYECINNTDLLGVLTDDLSTAVGNITDQLLLFLFPNESHK